MQDDVGAFADGHDADVEVVTVALDEQQIDQLGLARAVMPAKKRQRYPWWPHNWTVEAEALSPDDLAAIITDAIQARTSAESRQAVIQREAAERDALMQQLAE